jgi:hypothetical protein
MHTYIQRCAPRSHVRSARHERNQGDGTGGGSDGLTSALDHDDVSTRSRGDLFHFHVNT